MEAGPFLIPIWCSFQVGMKTTQQAVKESSSRVSLAVSALFKHRRLLPFNVVALAANYISECCVDTSKGREMTKAEKKRYVIYWQAVMNDGAVGVSLHSSRVLLDNADKLPQLFYTFYNLLAIYRYSSDPQSACL